MDKFIAISELRYIRKSSVCGIGSSDWDTQGFLDLNPEGSEYVIVKDEYFNNWCRELIGHKPEKVAING
jgi:hypothetical protein